MLAAQICNASSLAFTGSNAAPISSSANDGTSSGRPINGMPSKDRSRAFANSLCHFDASSRTYCEVTNSYCDRSNSHQRRVNSWRAAETTWALGRARRKLMIDVSMYTVCIAFYLSSRMFLPESPRRNHNLRRTKNGLFHNPVPPENRACCRRGQVNPKFRRCAGFHCRDCRFKCSEVFLKRSSAKLRHNVDRVETVPVRFRFHYRNSKVLGHLPYKSIEGLRAFKN